LGLFWHIEPPDQPVVSIYKCLFGTSCPVWSSLVNKISLPAGRQELFIVCPLGNIIYQTLIRN